MINRIHYYFIRNNLIPLLLIMGLFLIVPFFLQYDLIGVLGLFMPTSIRAWIVVVWFICLSLYSLSFKSYLVLPKYYGFIFAFPISILIGSLIAGVSLPIEWLFRMLFILGGLSFLLLLFQCEFNEKNINRLLLIIVLSAFINVVINVAEINFPALLENLLPLATNNETTGAFAQVNVNASYLATGLLLAFYLLSRPFPYLRKQSHNSYHYVYLCLLLLTIGLSTYIIIVSASRVGILSGGIGFMLLLISRRRQFQKRGVLTLLAIIAIIIGIGGATLGNNNFDKLNNKLENTFEQYSSARIGIYQVSIDIIKQKPLLGHGIGSFDSVFVEQAGVYLQQHPNAALSELDYINHPHNELLFWAIEAGLVSLIGLLAFSAYIIWALISLGGSRGIAYFTLLLPISLHTQVELPFYLSALHWFLFLVLIFIVLNHHTYIRKYNPTRYLKLTMRLMAGLILIIATMFLVDALRVSSNLIKHQAEAYENKYITDNIELLKSSLTNIYYSNHAERSLMTIWGIISIIEHNDKDVLAFTVWANNHLKTYPNYIIREKLLEAYMYLGKREEICATVNKSIFLHPKRPLFEEIKRVYQC